MYKKAADHVPLRDGEFVMDVTGTILDATPPRTPWTEEERIATEYAAYIPANRPANRVDWNDLESIFAQR